MVFLQTQVWSGHSLCLNHVGSSVPRIRLPPWVVYKDPSLSVPDCPSVSLNPFLPSLWYPIHAHLPTTGFGPDAFCHRVFAFASVLVPEGSFTHSVPALFLVIVQQSARNFLPLISLLWPPSSQTSYSRPSEHQAPFFRALITTTHLHWFVWLTTWLLSVLPRGCLIHKGRVPVRICPFSHPHHLTLCPTQSRCFKNLFK